MNPEIHAHLWPLVAWLTIGNIVWSVLKACVLDVFKTKPGRHGKKDV